MENLTFTSELLRECPPKPMSSHVVVVLTGSFEEERVLSVLHPYTRLRTPLHAARTAYAVGNGLHRLSWWGHTAERPSTPVRVNMSYRVIDYGALVLGRRSDPVGRVRAYVEAEILSDDGPATGGALPLAGGAPSSVGSALDNINAYAHEVGLSVESLSWMIDKSTSASDAGQIEIVADLDLIGADLVLRLMEDLDRLHRAYGGAGLHVETSETGTAAAPAGGRVLA